LVHDASDEKPPASDAAEIEAESTSPEKSGDASDCDAHQESTEPENSRNPGTSAEGTQAGAPARIHRRTGFLMPGIFDFLLVAFSWFLSTLLASRILETPFERLLADALTALLGYAAALSGWYVLLSRIVFGRTLGDRIFRRSEPD